MAYGWIQFTVLRTQASPTTREARGPPRLALWNGMGPSGYNRPPSCTFSPTRLCLIFLLFLLMPVEGKDKCTVDKCSLEFERFKQDLNITDEDIPDSLLICPAVRAYKHCVSNSAIPCDGTIIYHTTRTVVKQKINQYKCNMTGVVRETPKEPYLPVPPGCIFQGKKTYRHCGLFGDPHLRTFSNVFQTCRVKGAWPLVNNDHLIVQVTNDAVEGNTDATATSKLTVIVKGNALCTSKNFQTYQAQTNNLPGAFEDGHVTYGPYRSLELVEVDPGKHVEIHIRYIETVVVIRQIGRYFTFSIKMPEELINSSRSSRDLQLCARGCPRSELIDYKKYLAIRKHSLSQTSDFTRQEAEEICRAENLVDFYFDSCVFDLMATGDENFTMSAIRALQDVLKLQPHEAQTMDNRSSLETYDKQYGMGGNGQASSLRTSSSSSVGVLVVIVLLLTCVSSRTSLLPS